MIGIPQRGQRAIAACAAVAFLAIVTVCGAWQQAYADEQPLPVVGASEELTQLQAQIESTAKDYDDAVARAEQLRASIAENEQRLGEIAQQLPEQQSRSDESMRTLYFLHQDGFGLLDLLLSSESLTDFLDRVEYLGVIHEHNTAEIEKLGNLQSELEATTQQLEKDAHDADEAAFRAERALEQAKASREQAQQKAVAEAQAQIARQQEIAAAVAQQMNSNASAAATPAAAAATNVSQLASDPASSTLEDAYDSELVQAQGTDAANTQAPVASEEPEAEAQGTVDAASTPVASDRDSFIAEWSARIDAYLGGSPLAGQGATFATAAWNYGVDPRWSPAIAYAESSLGAACFLPHNAWGWGSSSWGSWEEAIDSHVAGLAHGYGYTITYEAAAKYCPPNANHWYNVVLAQMNSI